MKSMIFLIFLILVSCSSNSKKETESTNKEEPVIVNTNPVREFKLDYEVIDASDKQLQLWIKEPSLSENTSEERKKYRYFVNESSNQNQRLCEKSAEARATAHIASEIAQFFKNSYSEALQGGESEIATEYMQESLGQEAQSFIVGASVVKKYWEKRSYKVDLGANTDHIKFYCYAAVKIAKKDLEKAIDRSREKLLKQITAPEVKTKTKEVLKEIGKKFIELEKPIDTSIKNEEE